MAVPTGASAPPAAPCKKRKNTSIVKFDARPHKADVMVKSANATRKTRLVPQRSPNQPDAGMTTARLRRYATTTASIEVLGTPNWCPIEGRATLTIVPSMMLMNMPTTKTVLTLTLGFSWR